MDTDEKYIQPEIPETPINDPSVPKKSKKKERKYHMKRAPIEDLTEFEIAQYIKSLPSGLTIGQAVGQISKYRSAMLWSIRRKREANIASIRPHSEPPSHATAARCIVKIDENPVSVIIDSGAATSIITKKLMKLLGYSIDRKSKMVIIAVNGQKT